MSENKEEILANFQSITGIDDVGEAFSNLEDANWDLMAAIRCVMPQDDIPPPPPLIQDRNSTTPTSFNVSSTSTSVLNNLSTSAGTSMNSKRNNATDASTANNLSFRPTASTSFTKKPYSIVDPTSDSDTGSTKQNGVRYLLFNIHYNQQVYTIQLPSNASVEQLKEKIFNATSLPICRQAIRGWPPAKLQEAQKGTTKLNDLELSSENELILIDLTEEGYMDFENDEVASRRDKEFQLTIVQQPNGRNIELSMKGTCTVQDVKMNVFYITNINVRHQEWTGWPTGCNNNTTLAQSGIELTHNFVLHNSEHKEASTSATSVATITVDTDSSADDEFEDASDFNASEDFFNDSPTPPQPPSRHLISNNTDSEATGSIEFVNNYKQRFGEPVPNFFTGSLEDAIKAACNKPARERKLLAIYLHHGESILTNVFCDHLMKHESIIQTFTQSFILYGWDLTHESNKHLFLSSVTGCIGNTASMTVRNIALDKLPAILLIGKSRLSGRTSCEILSVIHGNVGLDDLLSRLIESVEVYSEHLQVEIREEDERAARDQVKAEQDMAYQEALQADMAKDAAKRQKEAAQAAEKQRLELEKAEDDARRESIRLVAEQALPKEPKDSEANISKIRVRKPTGEFLERRFRTENTLQDLLNFVASNGFLIDDYKVISSWPRRDLTAIDANQTIQSLKLYPQETVILEER